MLARASLVGSAGVLAAALTACDGGGGGPGGADSGGASSGGEAGAATGGAPAGGTPGSSGGATSTGGTPGEGSALGCRVDGDGQTTLAFVNRCAAPVQYAGSDIAGGLLLPGGVQCVDIGTDVEPLDAKRYWGFTGQDPGAERHSLAEFTFNTDFYDFDWYNISYVDAFNLPLQIVPVARPDCDTLLCAEDFLASCPEVGVEQDASGAVIACVSPDRDDADSPVALHFEQCDDAYAWSGDDQEGSDPSPVKACAGEDWDIVFCPEK